jgi:hypothetical protein
MSSEMLHGDTNGQRNGPTIEAAPTTAVEQARRGWLPERPRTQLMSEDDAGANLHLGEFSDVPTLSISEARILVGAIHARRQNAGKRWTETEVTHRMQNYMEIFARFSSEEQLKAVDSSMAPFKQMTMFEKSQLSECMVLHP